MLAVSFRISFWKRPMQGERLFGGDSFETYTGPPPTYILGKQELVQGDPLETNTLPLDILWEQVEFLIRSQKYIPQIRSIRLVKKLNMKWGSSEALDVFWGAPVSLELQCPRPMTNFKAAERRVRARPPVRKGGSL